MIQIYNSGQQMNGSLKIEKLLFLEIVKNLEIILYQFWITTSIIFKAYLCVLKLRSIFLYQEAISEYKFFLARLPHHPLPVLLSNLLKVESLKEIGCCKKSKARKGALYFKIHRLQKVLLILKNSDILGHIFIIISLYRILSLFHIGRNLFY